ncbi:hypothetical protein BLNAU_4325 [Blattamonas nauphoetae]|uniref:DDE-1 domain-containing protein n=1 Tax=Blattamonas nauphoetae TaxID=2049346 RepID=A0ABQ9YAA5_9EUKA|nr:hypothetical protein BLNAU_4325 [Blattamonas nauphoetae]
MTVSPPPLPSTLDAFKACCDFSKGVSKSKSPPIVLIDGTIVHQCQIQIQQFKTLSPASKTRALNSLLLGEMPQQNGNRQYLNKSEEEQLLHEILESICSGINPTFADIADMAHTIHISRFRFIPYDREPPSHTWHLIPEIARRRARLELQDAPALLIFDGHSSRFQPDLWKTLSEQNCDSICLPSNTSSITQPCDRGVNAVFKHHLKSLSPLPSKTKLADQLIPWLTSVETAAQHALSKTIINAFKSTGIPTADGSVKDRGKDWKLLLGDSDTEEKEVPEITKVKAKHLRQDGFDEYEDGSPSEDYAPIQKKKRRNSSLLHDLPNTFTCLSELISTHNSCPAADTLFVRFTMSITNIRVGRHHRPQSLHNLTRLRTHPRRSPSSLRTAPSKYPQHFPESPRVSPSRTSTHFLISHPRTFFGASRGVDRHAEGLTPFDAQTRPALPSKRPCLAPNRTGEDYLGSRGHRPVSHRPIASDDYESRTTAEQILPLCPFGHGAETFIMMIERSLDSLATKGEFELGQHTHSSEPSTSLFRRPFHLVRSEVDSVLASSEYALGDSAHLRFQSTRTSTHTSTVRFSCSPPFHLLPNLHETTPKNSYTKYTSHNYRTCPFCLGQKLNKQLCPFAVPPKNQPTNAFNSLLPILPQFQSPISPARHTRSHSFGAKSEMSFDLISHVPPSMDQASIINVSEHDATTKLMKSASTELALSPQLPSIEEELPTLRRFG